MFEIKLKRIKFNTKPSRTARPTEHLLHPAARGPDPFRLEDEDSCQ